MAEQHDIVLRLVDEFSAGITKANDTLKELGNLADAVATKIQSAINAIDLSKVNITIDQSRSSFSSYGDSGSKASEQISLALEKTNQIITTLSTNVANLTTSLQTAFTKTDSTQTIKQIDNVTQSISKEDEELKQLATSILSVDNANTQATQSTENIANSTKKAVVGMEAVRAAIKNTNVGFDEFIDRMRKAGQDIDSLTEKQVKALAQVIEKQNLALKSQAVKSVGSGTGLQFINPEQTEGFARAVAQVKKELTLLGADLSKISDQFIADIANKRLKDEASGWAKALDDVSRGYKDIVTQAKAIEILGKETAFVEEITKKYGITLVDLQDKFAKFLDTAKTNALKEINKDFEKLAVQNKIIPQKEKVETTKAIDDERAKLEAVAKAQTLINSLTEKQVQVYKQLNISEKQLQEAIAKRLQLHKTNQVDQLAASITGLGQESKKTYSLVDFMLRGVEIGFSHAVGAISVGANALRSIIHELVRNVSISIFNFSLKHVKNEFGSATKEAQTQGKVLQSAVENMAKVGENVKIFDNAKESTQGVTDIADAIDNLGKGADEAASIFRVFFDAINFRLAAISGGFILLGVVLDKIGDKFLQIGTDLAKVSGEYTLAFSQLNAVIEANEQVTGRALGTNEEWQKAIIETSKISGKTVQDISQLTAVFVGLDQAGQLSAKGLQELVEASAILSPLFRNQTELLTNVRNALLGNFRAINSNIYVAANQVEANQKFVDSLVRQGKSQEEANRIAQQTSQIEKNRSVIIEAAASRVNFLKNATDLLAVANLRLEGTLKNVQNALGQGSAAILARFTSLLVELLNVVLKLPEPLLNAIGAIALVGGAAANIGGKLLKLAGVVGLLAVAFTALNAVMTVTIPLLGTSLLYALNALAVRFGASLSLATTFAGALKIIFTAIINTYLPAILRFVAGFTLLGTILTTVILAFNKFSDSVGGVGTAFRALLSPLTAVYTSISDLIPDLEITSRVMAALKSVIILVAYWFNQAAVGAVALARGLIAIRQYFKDSKELQQRQQELLELQNQLTQSATKLNAEFDLQIFILRNGAKAAEDLERAFGDLYDAQDRLRKSQPLDENQLKALTQFVQNLRRQIDDLKIKNIELNFGKGAAETAKNLLDLKRTLLQINENNKESGLVIVSNEEIEKATTTKELLDKIASRPGGEALSKQIDQLFNQRTTLGNINEALDEQNKLVKKIVNEAENLHKSLSKQLFTLRENIDSQTQFAVELESSSDSTENIVKKLERERFVQDEIAKRRAQIVELEKQITESRDEQGNKIVIDERRRQLIQKQIREIENALPTLEVRLNADKALEDSNKFFTKLRQGIDDIAKKFSESITFNQDQLEVQKQYNKDLLIGVDYANQQRQVKLKELEINKEIKKLTDDINNNVLIDQSREAAIKRLQELEVLKKRGILLDQEAARIAIESNSSITQSIVDTSVSLVDQLTLLEKRSELFKQGVLTGDFNKIAGQITAFTSALDDLLEKQVKLSRLKSIQDTLGVDLGVTSEHIDNIANSIGFLTERLKALNFVKNIQDALNAVADAFEQVITDGVRGVFEGTQTISELFRKMAQNILLALANITAKNAIDGIKREFNDLASSLAKSDFAKKIASLFGIDLEILGQSPQQALEAATTSNTSAVSANTLSQQNLTTAIIGLTAKISGGIPGGVPTGGTGLGGGITTPIDQDMEELANGIAESWGTNIDRLIPQLDISTLNFFDEFDENIFEGFDSVTNIASQESTGFFSSLGELFTEGFKGIGDLFSGFDFGSIFSGALSLFGFSKGGLVPGRASKKDNQLRPVASGEFINNSDAVNYYGQDLFNALNNMSLPKNFLTDMESNSAPNRVAQIQPKIAPVSQVVQSNDDRPINITVIDKSPKLDPASFKMKPEEVTQIFVDGVRKDRVIRKVIREDLGNGGVR